MDLKIRLRHIKFSRWGLLYIVSMTIIGIHQAGIFSGYYLTPFIIGTLWFGLGILKRSNGNTLPCYKIIDSVITLFMVPWIVFVAYNVFLYMTGNGYMEFMKSSFVQIMFVPCIFLGVWGAYSMFGVNTLKYILYAIFLQYVVVLTVQFVRMGPSIFLSGIMTAFTGRSISNPFEANSDVVLSLGILLIYLSDEFVRRSDLKNGGFWLIAIVFFLGGKKICFLSMACIVVYMFFVRPIPGKKRINVQNTISGIIILGYFLFIYLIDSGILSAYIWSHGINTMGRINMWDYIAEFFRMNVNYLGNGYSFCNLLLERDRPYTFNGYVYTLHSDALKMYVEFGCVIFLFWLIYNLYIANNTIRKNYSYKVSNMYWGITAYMFLLYLTDNPINYYITQTIYVVVILQVIEMTKGKKYNLER